MLARVYGDDEQQVWDELQKMENEGKNLTPFKKK